MTSNCFEVSMGEFLLQELFSIQSLSLISDYIEWFTCFVLDYFVKLFTSQGQCSHRDDLNKTKAEGAFCIKAMPQLKVIKSEKPLEWETHRKVSEAAKT